MNRREILAAALAAAAATGAEATNQIVERAIAPAKPKNPAHEFPKVLADWWGQGMYEDLEKSGMGISVPGPAGRRKAFIAFDTQCPWCHRLHEQLIPLYPKVEVVWFPVATLSVWSEPQGALMLAAKDPWKLFLHHMDIFKTNENPRGIPVDTGRIWNIPRKFRDGVWTNSKIVRRNACRTIPYGVFKNSKGEFIPLYSRLTTADLAKIFEL
ncbi:MAG TPA: Tat pathway signal protein [Sutterella sp.]|nr:Tat pathway signal protein [Sutterella sp.]